MPEIEDAYGFDTLAVCHVLIHPIALPGAHLALGATRVGLSASQVDAVPIPPR